MSSCIFGRLPSISRYHCIILWSHGLPYADEVVSALEDDPDFDIIMLRIERGFSVPKFVDAVYACDTVPLQHLTDKNKYLKILPAEALFIFIKNNAPDEVPAGAPPFRKVQCRKMVAFKQFFREKYNPRVNGELTHDHVIHATDYESQTDYLLKLLGYAEGIRIFETRAPIYVPYHIQWTGQYRIESLPLTSLRASILFRDNEGVVTTKPVEIQETPHFVGIANPEVYANYLAEFRYIYLCDHYSLKKFALLQQSDIADVVTSNPVLTVQSDTHYTILDGVHRACVAMAVGIQKISAVIFHEH
jgi:hypothetical protein